MPLPDFISELWRKIGSGLGTRLIHMKILELKLTSFPGLEEEETWE